MTAGDEKLLAERFAEERSRLLAMASRMLGSVRAADHAVQEAWTRFSRGDAVEDPGRLTLVLARVCLETLTRRTAGRRAVWNVRSPYPMATLAPAERVAFMLHDLHGLPVEEVARILGRTPTATRQLAGRARRRLQSPELTLDAERAVQGRVVEAFLAASSTGDIEELAWLLHPEAVLHADPGAVAAGAPVGTRGAQAVAEAFAGLGRSARPVLLDGFAAAASAVDGRPEEVFGFTVVDGRIAEIEMVTDREVLLMLDLRPHAADQGSDA